MFSLAAPERKGSWGPEPRAILADLGRRAPIPQAVSLVSQSSPASNVSPTVTMTKTLYSAGETTVTRSESSTSSGGNEGTANSPSLSLDAGPFVGVAVTATASSTQANSTLAGTATTTGTSTVYNTVTVTSTSVSTTTVHDGSSSTALISLIGSNQTSHIVSTSTARHSVKPSTVADSGASQPKSSRGTVAGATIGSMAAFAMIGLLLWYCCFKKKGKRKIKFNFNIKRRKSSSAKTPQLKDQAMEEMRQKMLDQHKDLNDFLKGQPASSSNPTAIELPGDVGLKRDLSQTDSSRTHPSWIGVAVSSSTPPSTPPLPRSNSQRSARTTQNAAAASLGHRASLMSGPGLQNNHIPPSLMPTPLEPVMKPAPIITSPSLAQPGNVSPLSPRSMFNAISSSTSTAWRRASQALSPGGYQRIADDGPSVPANPKRRDSKPRIPELEIGHQTDKGWNRQWI